MRSLFFDLKGQFAPHQQDRPIGQGRLMPFFADKDDADQFRRRWTSPAFDADPYRLPASLAVPFQPIWRRAFGFIRYATIYRDRVVAQDSSPPLGVWEWEAPVTDYSGVVMAIAYKDRDREAPAILIELCHPDPTKTVTVHASFDGADAGARWRSWASVLNLPLLVQDRSGDLRETSEQVGALKTQAPQPHRGASPLTTRRPLSFGFTGRPRQWSDRVSASRPHAY